MYCKSTYEHISCISNIISFFLPLARILDVILCIRDMSNEDTLVMASEQRRLLPIESLAGPFFIVRRRRNPKGIVVRVSRTRPPRIWPR